MKTKYVGYLSLVRQNQNIDQVKAKLRVLRRRVNQALRAPRDTLTLEEREIIDAAVASEAALSAELKKLKAEFKADAKTYDDQVAAADKWQDEEDARLKAAGRE